MPSFRSHWLTYVLGAVLVAVAAFMFLNPTKARAADKGGPKQVDLLADVPVMKVSWTGFYVGGFLGYAIGEVTPSNAWFTADGRSATGRTAGATAGADWQLPNTLLVVGARASYTWNQEDFVATTVGIGKAGLRDGWSGDGRVGAALGTAMPYIGMGYTSVHMSAGGPDLRGTRYFGGVEFRLPKMDVSAGTALTPTLALEALYTDFESKKTGSITIDANDLAAMVRRNLRIGR